MQTELKREIRKGLRRKEVSKSIMEKLDIPKWLFYKIVRELEKRSPTKVWKNKN